MHKLNMNAPIQRQLIFAALDDFSPNGAFSDVCGGQYGETPDEWAIAVTDFIYNAMGLGLLEPMQSLHGFENLSAEGVRSLLIRSGTAPDYEESEDLTWDILYFHGTDRLRQVVSKFQLDNWEALACPIDARLFEYLNSPWQRSGCKGGSNETKL